jgi:hypothetical protein
MKQILEPWIGKLRIKRRADPGPDNEGFVMASGDRDANKIAVSSPSSQGFFK